MKTLWILTKYTLVWLVWTLINSTLSTHCFGADAQGTSSPEGLAGRSVTPGTKATVPSFRLSKLRGTTATFEIINRTSRDVVLSNLFPEESGRGFKPWFYEYQTKKDGRWVDVPAYYSGVSYDYRLRPGGKVKCQVDMRPFRHLPSGTNVRIKLGQVTSEEFLLK